jgi:dTDP-4-amino-4,6-dideoxygalactose transaminase
VIPFVDLRAQYLTIRDEVAAAIQGVLDSCQFTLGPEVAAFEHEFAQYCGSEIGVAVNTGTSALHLALLAAGIGPGDEVITVPFTFVATVSAIQYAGATPVLVDVDPHTLLMDVNQVAARITSRTRAIVPVHLYGQPVDMEALLRVAHQHGLVVIEDACQAHGAEVLGRRAGSLGDMGCFSFYPGKNLGAYGEGGMVVTARPDLARTLRMLRDWGAERKYQHELKGYNYRMDALQGAVLRVKLRHLERWTEARRALAERYNHALDAAGVSRPAVRPDVRHVWHLYVVRSAQRALWQERLQAQGIQTGIHYPAPVHLLPAFRDLGHKPGDFPHAEAAAREVLSLPMYPELGEARVDEVARAVAALASQPAALAA